MRRAETRPGQLAGEGDVAGDEGDDADLDRFGRRLFGGGDRVAAGREHEQEEEEEPAHALPPVAAWQPWSEAA
jgi:hypothetical protein